MATQEALRVSIQSHDVMGALLNPLRSANTVVQSKATLAVAATACDAEARVEVRILITFALMFLVWTCGWINSKHFQVSEPIRHLSPSKLVQRFGKRMGVT